MAGARMMRLVRQSLPPGWLPVARRGFTGLSARLPVSLRTRLYRAVDRIRPEMGSIQHDYRRWIQQYDRLDDPTRAVIADHIAGFRLRPVISIVMPVFNTDPRYLRQAIGSVRDQLYPHWELCIADDASTDPGVASVLRAAAAEDKRIKLAWRDRNGHISAASNTALELATGTFAGLMDHDDVLSPRALYEVVRAINARPDADILYSDEDHIDDEGRRSQPYFKPDWNPELMLGQNLISHFGVYRRALLDRAGGFRPGFEGSQDHDLALRAIAKTAANRIVHIPRVLYHWRQRGARRSFSEAGLHRCANAGRRAVAEFLSQIAPGAHVEPAPLQGSWHRVIYPMPLPEPLVSVIIPTRDHAEMLRRTMDGLLNRTDYKALDVIVVDNGSQQPAALALLDSLSSDPRVRVLRRPGPFNYSALNNDAVRQARGALILLLNNDIDVIEPHWLHEMVSHAVRPGIGAVGAKLLYPDGSVQHAGVITGMFGVAGHHFLNRPRQDAGYFGHLALARNVTAVTAACLLVRRDLYMQVGGLNEAALPVAFNDVELCLRLIEAGCRNVWTPFAELFHHESASRGSDHTPEKIARFQSEVAYMRQRWGAVLDRDPNWNPNLSLRSLDVALAFPPRLEETAPAQPGQNEPANPEETEPAKSAKTESVRPGQPKPVQANQAA